MRMPTVRPSHFQRAPSLLWSYTSQWVGVGLLPIFHFHLCLIVAISEWTIFCLASMQFFTNYKWIMMFITKGTSFRCLQKQRHITGPECNATRMKARLQCYRFDTTWREIHISQERTRWFSIILQEEIHTRRPTMVLVKIREVDVEFPFEPYGCQISYMEKVIQCLQEVCVLYQYFSYGL